VSEPLGEALARIVGPRWVRSRPAELRTFEADGLPTHAARPRLVVLPGSRGEVIEVEAPVGTVTYRIEQIER